MVDIFASIEKLITEHGSAAILKQHVELLKDKMSSLEKEAASSGQKIAELEAENKRLRAQAAKLDKTGFVTYRGLLWKPEGNGYEPTPYCPRCKNILGQWPPGAQETWCCTDQCGLVVDWFAGPTDTVV